MTSLLQRIGLKSKPIVVSALVESTREGEHKAFIPQFLYKPPYGYPRGEDLVYLRFLAKSPYVQMCIDTIIDEVSGVKWKIGFKQGTENKYKTEDNKIKPEKQKEIDHITNFLKNPNSTQESFEDVFIRMPVRDLLEIGNGVLIKVFNLKGEMTEVYARDGVTFTKNPDIYGTFNGKQDIIMAKDIAEMSVEVVNDPLQKIPEFAVREKAAYFQYGWNTASRAVPFGYREIVWIEISPRTNSIYANSPVSTLQTTLQTLIYATDNSLDLFSNNNMPRQIVGLDGADSADLLALQTLMKNKGMIKDEFGNWRRNLHYTPFINYVPKVEKMQLNPQELELLESQKWYFKLVLAQFGVTATQVGYTEDAKGVGNQIVQSKISGKKAIYPILRILEEQYNKQIISEFGYEDLEFKYLVEDFDEEITKYELYKLQLETIKTINEVRSAEGLAPLEGGDKLKKLSFGTNFNQDNQNNSKENFFDRGKEAQDTEENIDKNKDLQKKNLIEGKPFAGYDNFKDCVNKNKDKRDPEAYCSTIMRQVEGKIMNTNSPLTLQEGEELSQKKLKQAILHVLKLNEKKLKELIEKEGKPYIAKQSKGIRELATMLKQILSFEGLKQIVSGVIKTEYNKGWEEGEKDVNMNFIPDQDAIDFLSTHTFDNIKGMTDEIADDLRQELQRGFMAGEGVPELKKRVTKVFKVGKNRAEMIARTESIRASNFGKLGALKAAGIKGKKVWVSKIDDRTSDICKRLDGQEVAIGENFVDERTGWKGQGPPSHVNCRSTFTTIPNIKP